MLKLHLHLTFSESHRLGNVIRDVLSYLLRLGGLHRDQGAHANVVWRLLVSEPVTLY